MFSSCALQVTRVCSLAAVLRPSAAAATGSAAFGRAGAFGARWHLHWHAIVSSRAVQSRASARSQALDATCVSRKRHQVHGDASFCAERKIPTNIAGIADKVTVRSRRANAQGGQKRPFAGHGKHFTKIEFRASTLLFFLKKRGFREKSYPLCAVVFLPGWSCPGRTWAAEVLRLHSPMLCRTVRQGWTLGWDPGPLT